MGTRSMIYILDDRADSVLISIYTHYDGYPDYVGMKIHDILTGKGIEDASFITTVTAVDGSERTVLTHNGMECLSASFVKYYKDRPMNVYIVPSPVMQSNDDVAALLDDASRGGAEFTYILSRFTGSDIIRMRCFNGNDELFDDMIHKFPEFIENQKKQKESADTTNAAPGVFDVATIAGDIEMIAMPEYQL